MITEHIISDNHLPLVFEADSPDSGTFEKLKEFIACRKEEIFSKLHNHGALLFRGFSLNDHMCLHDFTCLLGSKFDYRGGDSPRQKIVESIYTSTSFPSEYSLPMHHEMSYSRRFPRYIMFLCMIPAQSGGETPLLDARKLYRSLSPRIIDSFATKELKYIQNLPSGPGLGKSWQETFEENDPQILEENLRKLNIPFIWKANGQLRIEEIVDPIIKHPITKEEVFFSQADQWHSSNLDPHTRAALLEIIPEEDLYHNCFYGDGSLLDPVDLDEIRAACTAKMVLFQWQQGDLLLVDNILVMHGRMPFSGERKILVAMVDA